MRLQSIKGVRYLRDYRLKLVFTDGFVAEIDLAPLVQEPRGPLEAQLQDPAVFSRAECDGYTLAWPNGYDLCPDVLRYWCEQGRVCSQAETDAHFAAYPLQPADAMALKDEPSKN